MRPSHFYGLVSYAKVADQWQPFSLCLQVWESWHLACTLNILQGTLFSQILCMVIIFNSILSFVSHRYDAHVQHVWSLEQQSAPCKSFDTQNALIHHLQGVHVLRWTKILCFTGLIVVDWRGKSHMGPKRLSKLGCDSSSMLQSGAKIKRVGLWPVEKIELLNQHSKGVCTWFFWIISQGHKSID